MRERGKDLPQVTVSREEFIKRAVADGLPEEHAAIHATVCEHLGSACKIGDELVSVEPRPPEPVKEEDNQPPESEA